MKTPKSLIALALVLAFNSGALARPSADPDTCPLVSESGPAPAQSFGARMAKARAAKSKTPKAHKQKSAKTPRVPRAPKVPVADGI